MSTESQKFWQDYLARNGSIDVPELLDAYAEHLGQNVPHEYQLTAVAIAPRPQPLNTQDMWEYVAEWCEKNTNKSFPRYHSFMRHTLNWEIAIDNVKVASVRLGHYGNNTDEAGIIRAYAIIQLIENQLIQ